MKKYFFLGKKLRFYRNKKGISLKRLASVIKVTYTYLSKLEHGVERPSEEVLERLKDYFNLNLIEAAELHSLAGFGKGVISGVVNENKKEKATKLNILNPDNKQEVKKEQTVVNLDPLRTPVLYADSIYIKVNPNGVVLDIAQQHGLTNNFSIVGRVGLSHQHAKILIEKLTNLLQKSSEKKGAGKGTGNIELIN